MTYDECYKAWLAEYERKKVPAFCTARAHGPWTDATKATGWLFAPDGEPCISGTMCAEHGEAVVKEFKEKLGEVWTFRPLAEGFAVRAARSDKRVAA